MVLLESEQFLTELTRLFQKCRTSGSVYITLKKCKQREGSRAMLPGCPVSGSHRSLSAADRRLPLPSVTLYWAHSGLRAWKMMGIVAGAVPSAEPPRLLLVSSKEVNKFQMAYSNLLRANMDGLKKRDKKNKTKKTKAAAAAAAAAVAAAAAPAAAATTATPATPAATAATAAQ
uniref:Signal recognition particle 14 kDa protein n=1 Tax=Macaca mulatta TaxID=9544 RepID=A0A5F8AM26_MACMU